MSNDNKQSPPDAISEARGQFNRSIYELGVATYEYELAVMRKEAALKKAANNAQAVNELIAKAKEELAKAATPPVDPKPALTLLDGGAADAPAKG